MHHPAEERHRRSTVAVAASVVFVVAGLVGCGGDETPAEAQEFCAALEAIEDLDVAEAGVDAFTSALVRLDETAPEAIAEDAAVLRAFVERSAEIGELPVEDQEAAISEFSAQQAEFDLALEDIEDYARANCPDLEESFLE